MAFSLQFDASGCIRNSFSTIIATIKPRIQSTPNLAYNLIFMNFNTIKIYRDNRIFNMFAIPEPCCPEFNIISIPFPGAVI